MRRIILLIMAFTFICAPLLAEEGASADGAGADAAASAGCSRVNLGGMGEAPAEGDGTSTDTDAKNGDTDAALQDQAAYNQSQQGEMVDLECQETPNPDGTCTCYNTDGSPLSCHTADGSAPVSCVDETVELVCYQ